MNRDHQKDFQEVAFLVGDGDRGVGRTRIAKLCCALQSAISNWKATGIPIEQQAKISNYLKKSGKRCPGWLLDIDVPVGDAIDLLPLKSSSREKVPA